MAFSFAFSFDCYLDVVELLIMHIVHVMKGSALVIPAKIAANGKMHLMKIKHLFLYRHCQNSMIKTLYTV